MSTYAVVLAKRLWILRSGGADGADSAFESCAGMANIFLPWSGFNGHKTGFVVGASTRLATIAADYHPAWSKLSEGAKRLHTRNVAQVLGANPPDSAESSFVLCWTPGAKGGGGTGQAIRIAKAYSIPVYDLADPNNTFERDWL